MVKKKLKLIFIDNELTIIKKIKFPKLLTHILFLFI